MAVAVGLPADFHFLKIIHLSRDTNTWQVCDRVHTTITRDILNPKLNCKRKPLGSGYSFPYGPSHLKPYSSATCNMTVMHNESVVGLAETY